MVGHHAANVPMPPCRGVTGRRSSFIAGLRNDGIVAPFVFGGAMNGLIFRHCIAEQPGPTLRPGDVVVMDNLSTHEAAAFAS